MKNRKIIITILLSMTLLFGCDIHKKNSEANIENKEITFNTVASENSVPDNFYEIAFLPETSSHNRYLIKKIDNQKSFDENLKLYGIKNSTSIVNFNESVILFLSVSDHVSCPSLSVIDNMKLNEDTLIVTISKSDDGDSTFFEKTETICHADVKTKTFIVQTNKNLLENIKNISIIQHGVKTTIPL